MGYHLRLANFDKTFLQASRPPFIVNSFNTNSKEDRQRLADLLFMRYHGDTLDVIPACECGKIEGQYNADITCDVCHTKPRAVTERPLESGLWMAAPEGVVSLFNPTAWIILSKALYDNGQRMLEWMTSPTYALGHEPKHRMRKLVDLYRERGWQRGLNFFVTNFDQVFAALVEFKLLYNNKPTALTALVEFVRMYRECLFPRHLPLPSRLSFITEDTVTGRYADTSMTTAIDAALTISDMAHSKLPLSQRVREAKTVKTIMLLASFYETTIGKTLGRKEGWWRKHVFGSRLHMSARGVITSISDNHIYDEVHLPWSMSVMLFRVYLTSKLMRLGYTPNECIEFIYEHTLRYHPLIDQLFQELIVEGFGIAPDTDMRFGIPIILQRNPSLQRGSAQCLRVTKIKTNPRDNSIGMSVLVLAGANADFDGDALNLIVIPDERMYQAFRRLEPHLTALDLRRPWAISGNLKIPAPVTISMVNWAASER